MKSIDTPDRSPAADTRATNTKKYREKRQGVRLRALNDVRKTENRKGLTAFESVEMKRARRENVAERGWE